MTLQTRLSDFITAVGTDYKQLRTWITGSTSGTLTALTTTNKASLVGAINEVNGKAAPAPAAASETVSGILQIATQAETTAGAIDTDAVSPLKLQQKLTEWAQPLDADLTAISAVASQTDYGRGFLALTNATQLTARVSSASETVVGKLRIATSAEATAGTLATLAAITPLRLQEKLNEWAQPLNANLTTLAGVISGAFGRTLLGTADAAAAKTALGLAAVATTGSASDITTGTLPTSVLPPLAINETFSAASEPEMLALVAQRGDVAIRSDVSRSYILAADDPTILANWKQLTAGGDVLSVAGKSGVVTLVKADVGLDQVDNTSDSDKPISTTQQTALDTKLARSSNLSDLTDVASARTNLSVYSTTEIGNPETDLEALYTIAKS